MPTKPEKLKEIRIEDGETIVDHPAIFEISCDPPIPSIIPIIPPIKDSVSASMMNCSRIS